MKQTYVNVIVTKSGNFYENFLFVGKNGVKTIKRAEKKFESIIAEFFGGVVDGEILDMYINNGCYDSDNGTSVYLSMPTIKAIKK